MTREEIKNTPEIVDFMLDKCVLADSRTKVRKRLEEVCDLAIKAVEQESVITKIRADIEDTLYVDSLIFGELIDFRNGKISADDVIEEFNRVTRIEVLKIFDKYKTESEEE